MRLRHHRRRNCAILTDQSGDIIPPATVTDQPFVDEQPFAIEAIHIAKFNDILQVKIRFLHFVPKLKISIGKLETVQAEFVDDLRTHHIKAREHPAPSRGLLIGNPLSLNLVTKVPVLARDDLTI